MELWFYVVLTICWLFFAAFIVWWMYSAEERRHEDERFVNQSRHVMIKRYLEEQ